MHYEIHGRKSDDAETVVLSSGLGGAGAYWAPQLAALAPYFRVVTYDHRGTGKTGGEVPENGGITAMADDVLEIADELALKRFHLVGHALGGLIGLDIALHHPDRIDRLVLVNAWSKADPHSGRCFDVRIALLQHAGLSAFVKAQPLFLYPAPWMAENAERLATEEAHAIAHFQGETNILRRIAALRAFDIDDRIAEIRSRVLLMATRDDLLVPYTRSVRLADVITNARLQLDDFGGHAANITYPDRFNRDLIAFLTDGLEKSVS